MSLDNPFQSPETVSVHTASPTDRDRLRRIASAQRQVNIAVLLYLSLIPVNMVLGAIGSGSMWAPVLVLVLGLVVLGLGAISVFKLASIFRGKLVAVIYVLGLIVPLLGLLLLLSISSKATKELRNAGFQVGLMGVNPNSI